MSIRKDTKATRATIYGFTEGYIPFGAADNSLDEDSNLFWDNTNKRLGIGTDSPDYNLHVLRGTATGQSSGSLSIATFERNDHGFIQFLNPNDKQTGFDFGDTEDANVGRFIYDHADNEMEFHAGAQASLKIGSNYIWQTKDNDKHYFGAAQDASIYYDGTNLRINPREVGSGDIFIEGCDIGIGTTTPTFDFELQEDKNGITAMSVKNNTTGTSALAGHAIIADGGIGSFLVTSSGYTPSGSVLPNQFIVQAESSLTNGILLRTGSTGPIIFGPNTTDALIIRNGGNVEIVNDNAKLLFGAGQDASIYYDGTDIIINPDEVGTGGIFLNSTLFLDNVGTDNLLIGGGNKSVSGSDNLIIGNGTPALTSGSSNLCFGQESLII